MVQMRYDNATLTGLRYAGAFIKPMVETIGYVMSPLWGFKTSIGDMPTGLNGFKRRYKSRLYKWT